MSQMVWKWHAVGRRKTAVARVWMRPGTGALLINGSPGGRIPEASGAQDDRPTSRSKSPRRSASSTSPCNCAGGGLSGQAYAIKHGISRALLEVSTEKYRAILKRGGFLTRDSRGKERKKYGLAAARRRFQFSKR